jgi:Mrp family chromosome partitioning ATPase
VTPVADVMGDRDAVARAATDVRRETRGPHQMNDSPLASYLVPFRRYWWLVVGAVVLALGGATLTMPSSSEAEQVSSYQATHLLIRNGEAPTQLSFDLINLLARQGDLFNRVSARSGGDVSVSEAQSVQFVADPATQTLAVTAIRPTPEGSAELASLFAAELVTFLDERTRDTIENDYQRVTERLEEMQASLNNLEERIEARPPEDTERRLLQADLDALVTEFATLRSQQRSLANQREGTTPGFVTLEEPSPVPSEDAESPLALPARPAIRLALAAFIALVLAGATILVIDRIDTKVRTRSGAEEAFGLPVVAELPRRPRRHIQRQPLPAYHDPGGVTAEVLRALRLSLSLAPSWQLTSLSRDESGAVGGKTPVRLGHEPRSIVITSSLTGDGKSTLAANLAVSLAESGKRVLVVDCDFRRPAVGALLEVEQGLGMRELAHVGERPLRELAAPTVAPNVAMVRSGSRGVTPPWFAGEASELVRRATEMADVVIFDTGPITLTNEASALLPHVDTSLVVARAGKVATDQARGAVEQLTRLDARVAGVVLVGSEGRRRYGYGYYRGEKGGASAPVRAEFPTHRRRGDPGECPSCRDYGGGRDDARWTTLPTFHPRGGDAGLLLRSCAPSRARYESAISVEPGRRGKGGRAVLGGSPARTLADQGAWTRWGRATSREYGQIDRPDTLPGGGCLPPSG